MGMEASDLQFAAGAFDVVLQRHSSVYVREVVRGAASGGVFHHPDGRQRSSLNILDVFGWTPDSFGPVGGSR